MRLSGDLCVAGFAIDQAGRIGAIGYDGQRNHARSETRSLSGARNPYDHVTHRIEIPIGEGRASSRLGRVPVYEDGGPYM